MNIEQVEAFIAVTNFGNFSLAAESLYISQPTLSYRIDELERELGVKLFVRGKGKRAVQLTEQGRNFIVLSEDWKKLMAMTSRLKEIKTREKLRITTTHTLNLPFVNVVKKFSSRQLPVYMHIMSSASIDAFRRMENDEADFAIVSNTINSRYARAQLVGREKLVFVSSKNSAYRDFVKVADLECKNEIYINWGPNHKLWHDYWFGLDKDPLIRIENAPLADTFFSDDNPHIWMLLSLSVAKLFEERGSVKISEIDNPLPPRGIYLVSRIPIKQPYHDFLLEDLRSVLAESENFTLVQ